MKLQHPKGALEVREIIAYRVEYDQFEVRHDTKFGSEQVTVRDLLTASSADKAALVAQLTGFRRTSADNLAHVLTAKGIDHSQTSAPPMPHGWMNPEWAQ
jgi:hypothetical protein